MVVNEDQDRTNDYKVFHVDTNILDIYAFSSDKKPSKKVVNSRGFIPREEWIKHSKTERKAILAKRKQEKLSSINRQVKAHNVHNLINLDDLIDYNINKHNVTSGDAIAIDEPLNCNDDILLAIMAGWTPSSSSQGDICHVLTAKCNPTKPFIPRPAHGAVISPPTLTSYNHSLVGHRLTPLSALLQSPLGMPVAMSLTPSNNTGISTFQPVMSNVAMKPWILIQSSAICQRWTTAAQIFVG
jgi:hypothetical protein